MTADAERWLTLLESVMAAESFETAVAESARQFGSATQALATGLFIVMRGRVFMECWHPEHDARRAQLRAHFHTLAIQSAEEGGPVVTPFPEQAATSLVPSVHLLPLRRRLTGVLCLAFPPQSAPSSGGEPSVLERMVRLVAAKLAGLQEFESERRRSSQFERWFRTSDMQIRALDRERQKFAALVNALDACVFVADLTGSIRWTNRPLLKLIPAPDDGGTWIGRPCRELCQSASGGGEPACGTCPVAGAMDPGRVVIDPTRASAPARDRPPYATALPIRSLEGRIEEAIVVLRGVQDPEQRAA